jgi:IclR family acetate operon transcriptional repressor
VQTIDRIVSVMERVAASRSGLTLSEIARETGLAPATCHRLLSSLATSGLVERQETTKTWRPGIALIRIAAAVVPGEGLGPLVDRGLTTLRDRWQEFLFLGVLSDGQVVCARSIQTSETHRINISIPIGRRLVMHASASSRAILAELPAAEARRLLSASPRRQFTSATVTSIPAVMKELDTVRDRGYATCIDELEYGMSAYAVAVAGLPGEPPRSLAVVGPGARLERRIEEGLIDDLIRTGTEISDAMGAVGAGALGAPRTDAGPSNGKAKRAVDARVGSD